MVKYDITEPTLVCIHASVPAGSAVRPYAPQQTKDDEKGVNIYGIKIAPEGLTGVESVQPSAVRSQKVIRNGQLYIRRDGKTYNVTGVEVR